MIICCLFLLVLLLFFPSIALEGSRYGLSLWLTELLPVLLPFFIAVRLFQHCLPKAAKKRVFLFTGFLCGYPVGASLVTYQYDRGLLSKKQAFFYLGFVNNPSPMFVIVFCCQHMLSLPQAEGALFFVFIIACSLAGSALFSLVMPRNEYFVPQNIPAEAGKHPASSSKLPASGILDGIILDSFSVLLNIAGYVVLFSIFGQLLHTVISSPVFSALGSGLLEISSGASYLRDVAADADLKKALMAAILAFGGLSAAFQTSSILVKSKLSFFPYLLNKAINSAIAFFASLLLFRIF